MFRYIAQHGQPPYYAVEPWAEAGLPHGFFTRLGGASAAPFASLNVGRTVGDDPAHVAANLRAIAQALGFAPEQLVSGHQVHGDRVGLVTVSHGGQVLPETDALISNVPGLALLLRFADCVPVLLYAPTHGAIGVAHAGWKGTLARIAAKTALAMQAQFGCEPAQIRAAIGPSIGPCCFEVGPEVVAAARRAFGAEAESLLSRHQPNGKAHLDLWLANRLQLEQIGVQWMMNTSLCTVCHADVYYSHRAEHGRTGRNAAVIGLGHTAAQTEASR
jgi:hypothetical protein